MIRDAMGRQVLGGGGVLPVEVHALGDELRRLWAEDAEPAGAGGTDSSAVTRACTRNLVVLCGDEAMAHQAGAMINGVADRYPSRAFVVCRVEAPADRLEATLEAQCRLLPGGRHVCCEQIGLHVGPAAGKRAASAIVPLLVPDLPVFVWSLDAPPWEDALFERLLDVADRLVVDSRACPEPARFLVDLAGRDRDARWAPSDFEWARLAGWREAVATLFEDPALAPGDVPVKRIAVRHGARGEPGAALLAGWILDRLDAAGLPLPEATAGGVAFERTSGKGGLERVEIVREDGAVLTIEWPGTGSPLHLELVAPRACAYPAGVPCERAAAENLLEDLLAEHATEPLYERALARAATLVGP